MVVVLFFFFKQKTAYEMRISDWSSDVCSSDLQCKGVNEQYTLSLRPDERLSRLGKHRFGGACIQIACKFAPDACPYELQRSLEIGRASCRERVCQYV